MKYNDELERLKLERQQQPENFGLLIGTCDEYCPRYEFLDRLLRKDVSKFEMDSEGRYVFVKKYQRSAAGKTKAFCEDIRTLDALERVTDYLLSLICASQDLEYVHEVYKFIEDRLRAVRLDISVQGLCNEITITVLQKIVNFYAISNFQLYNHQDFEIHINSEQLKRTMTDLMQMYKILNLNVPNDRRSQPHHTAYTISYLSYQTYNDYYFLININDPEVFFSMNDFSNKKLLISYQQNNFYDFFKFYLKLDFTSICFLLPFVTKIVHKNIKIIKKHFKDFLDLKYFSKIFVLSKKEILSIFIKEGILVLKDEKGSRKVNLQEKGNEKETKIERNICKEINKRRIFDTKLLVFYGAIDKRIRSIVLMELCKEMYNLSCGTVVAGPGRERDGPSRDSSSRDDRSRDGHSLDNAERDGHGRDNDSRDGHGRNIHSQDGHGRDGHGGGGHGGDGRRINMHKSGDAGGGFDIKSEEAPARESMHKRGGNVEGFAKEYAAMEYMRYGEENGRVYAMNCSKPFENQIKERVHNVTGIDPSKMNSKFEGTKSDSASNLVNAGTVFGANAENVSGANAGVNFESLKKYFFTNFLYDFLLEKQKNEVLQKKVVKTIKNMKRNSKGTKNILLVAKNYEKSLLNLFSYFNFEITFLKFDNFSEIQNSFHFVIFFDCKPKMKLLTNYCVLKKMKDVNEKLIDTIYFSNKFNVEKMFCKNRKEILKYLIDYKNANNTIIEECIINMQLGL